MMLLILNRPNYNQYVGLPQHQQQQQQQPPQPPPPPQPPQQSQGQEQINMFNSTQRLVLLQY